MTPAETFVRRLMLAVVILGAALLLLHKRATPAAQVETADKFTPVSNGLVEISSSTPSGAPDRYATIYGGATNVVEDVEDYRAVYSTVTITYDGKRGVWVRRWR